MCPTVLVDRLSTLTDRLNRKGKWRASHRAKMKKRRKAKRLADTSIDLTFPERLKPLAEKFYNQALTHPAFVLMSPSEVRQSIEHRLWSIASCFPMWFGSGHATKREATEAQLAALEKARQAKVLLTEEDLLRERRIGERVQAAITSSQG